MHFTNYTEHDGYYESICSLKEGLGPILFSRVIKRSDGDYDSVVRDYSTGKMVASNIKIVLLDIAKDMAKTLAVTFIMSEIADILTGKGIYNGQNHRP